MAFTKIAPAGLSTSGNFTFGDVTVNSIQLSDGSAVGGAGLGTAIDGNDQIYYTDTVLSIGSTTTINPPDSSNVAYTQYAEIAVEEGFDLIIEDGDDFVPDILGLSTGTAAPLAGAGGRVRADNFTNKAGTGAPTFPNGVNVTGVSTFGNTVVGGATTELIVTGDARVTGILTIGTSSITLDGSENQVNVGTGVTIHHTNGVQVGGNTVHSTGITVNDINASGIITSTGITVNDINASGIITSTSIVVGNTVITSTSIGIGTTTTAGKNAGIGTAVGTLVYDSNLNRLEVYTPVGWTKAAEESFTVTVSPGSITANTGRSGYIYYTFTGAGSFVITGAPGTLEYLVVGGGGAGGNTSGGGGGAGGFVTGTFTNLGPGTYTVQVGGGGVSPATNGTPSYITNPGITSATAQGGGLGGGFDTAGGPGGSGGGGGSRVPGGANGGFPGGSGNKVTGTSTASTPNTQGSNGGDGYAQPASYSGGGGGGGAGGAGGQGGPYPGQAGNGGPGQPSSITGSSVLYAGGGGGGSELMAAGAAGPGGGGAGARFADGPGQPNPGATAGTANKGGGGGGGHITHANGGSGVVIIAYPTS